MARRTDTKALTTKLRELGEQVHGMTPDGDILTRLDALGLLIWNKALGYEDVEKDEEGRDRKVTRKPEAWAQQLIYDRLEGKTPMAVQESEGRRTAAEQVRELSRNRVNALALSVSGGGLKKKGPPSAKKDGP